MSKLKSGGGSGLFLSNQLTGSVPSQIGLAVQMNANMNVGGNSFNATLPTGTETPSPTPTMSPLVYPAPAHESPMRTTQTTLMPSHMQCRDRQSRRDERVVDIEVKLALREFADW